MFLCCGFCYGIKREWKNAKKEEYAKIRRNSRKFKRNSTEGAVQQIVGIYRMSR
jgi:hypothetical protein